MKTHERLKPKAHDAWISFGALLLSWSIFLVLLRYVWPYTGITEGEALSGAAAYAWIHQIPNMMAVPYIHFLGRDIPAMFNIHHGPWGIYFLTPFVALGGCTLATLRFYSAFMFFFALWGTWRLAILLGGGKMAAFLSAFLLAVCPAMVMTRSTLITAPDVAASVWALCFAASFARTRKPAYAYAAVAAFSVGLCTRAWVAGLGAGLLLCLALTWRRARALLPESRAEKTRFIGGCLACAGIFLLPAITYNAGNGWPTFKFLSSHLINRWSFVCNSLPHQNCSNLYYWTNLKASISQLAMLCDGDEYSVLSREPWHWLYVLPLLLSFFYAARDVWRRRTLWSVPAMLWIVVIGYVLVSAITPTGEYMVHLTPLAPLLCALMFSWMAALPAGTAYRTTIPVLALLCLAQFAGDFHLLNRRNIDLDKLGQYDESPLLIEACRWAASRPRTPIVSMSYPFSLAAPYFSRNQARLILWRYGGWPSDKVPWRFWLVRKDRPLFLIESNQLGLSQVAALKAAAKKFGIPMVPVKVFADSSGRPAFELYQAQ